MYLERAHPAFFTALVVLVVFSIYIILNSIVFKNISRRHPVTQDMIWSNQVINNQDLIDFFV